MTDKPFCLIDEAAKILAQRFLEDLPDAQMTLEQYWSDDDARKAWREDAKAVLDRIVPLIVERCAEVVGDLGSAVSNNQTEEQKQYWRGYHDACDGAAGLIRALKPEGKKDG